MNDTMPPSQRGFALVETLIAAAIIAGMSVAAFQMIATHAKSVTAVAERRAAILMARSALDAAVGGAEPSSMVSAGNPPLRTTIEISPYRSAAGSAPALDLVTVRVTRANSSHVVTQLRSLRVGR